MLQLNTILAVTDLTAASDACLQAAADIARVTGCRVRVVNALPGQLALTEYLRLVFTPNRFAGTQANALQEQLARVFQDTIQAEVVANLDPTADWVVQQAREAEAGLIILSRSVSPDLAITVVERALVPTLIVGREMELPIKRAILPIATPVPNQQTIALAKSWAEVFSFATTDILPDTAELELLQMVYISAESGSAAAAVRALRGSSTESAGVKLSWRAASAEPPARQVRRLAGRADADVIIAPLKVKREKATAGKLSSLGRSILRACEQPVLILPVLRQPATAIA